MAQESCRNAYPRLRRDLQEVLGSHLFDQHLIACDRWPRGQIPDDWLSPVVSDVPVLLISAELDPSTPPRTGQGVVEHLSKGLLVVMRNETHGAEINWDTCGEPLSQELLRTGNTDDLDTSCASLIERAPFVTECRTFGPDGRTLGSCGF